ncbi:MAG: NAD+ synthase [Candidatus Omnitrophica bacterium CG11_big_fil_rev_8_21_14_0_20_63_9]|nr:MAG: NAD+ synthase [Candidatus Omnitrophica bacterium CG11_big_fil_rev_8_21_14_0_20_63_9]
MSHLRLALAQLNVTVGDLEGNRLLIETAIRRAQAWWADLVVVPELAVTGYPPEDLLLKPSFIQANLNSLARLAPLTRGVTALVGFVDQDRQGRIYNAMGVLSDGRHVATYHKRFLPNYGVFDEKRYFTPGSELRLLNAGGVTVGLTICEDLWEERPCRELAAAGAQLVINASASPYHAQKLVVREQFFRERARHNRIAIAYCNLIGGQDELVFDGGSLCLNAQGREVARAAQFQEDITVLDVKLEWLGRARKTGRATAVWPRALRERPCVPLESAQRLGAEEEVYEALVLGVRDYFRKNGFSTAVMGLSGGIDSSLTACIAADALGPGHVMGVVMPSRYSSRETQEDAHATGDMLGIEVQELSIEPVFRAYLETLKPFLGDNATDVTAQNIQARIRGNVLMALSNKFGWLVLTTGNKSEFATGYCTLYGDMAGGFAVIKDVPKTLVYRLAAFRNRRGPGVPIPQSVIQRIPTAELAPNQTDQDTLPPYDVLDRILKSYVEENRSFQQILSQNHVPPETARNVIQMVDRAEYKRRQGSPGVKITPRAFGKDRRMPITNRYRQS